MQVHVSTSSPVADHCILHALSDPIDADFKQTCHHEHTVKCDRRDILVSVLDEIVLVSKDVKCPTEDKDEIEYLICQSIKSIKDWKAHLLRSINQDEAKHDILNQLDENALLLVSDWAMKYLPRKYRESQRDWFGKRGISWYITVAMKKSTNGDIQMLTLVHIFEKCTQDNHTVLAIFDDVIKQLKTVLPTLSTVYMKQDNAGCYHSALALLSIQKIAINYGIKVARLDFSEPQGGKGSCNRKAASIKNHMKSYLFSGHNIETADEMKCTMESTGGIPGVCVAVCLPPTDAAPICKLEGVSYINNIEYNENGMIVWKAYKIGKGKIMLWNNLNLPTTLPRLSKTHPENPETSFVSIKPRKESSESSLNQEAESSENDDQFDNEYDDFEGTTDDKKLFFCPEDGCIKSFQRYSSFQKHLDSERHKYSLENMTLYDKTMIQYAKKLEQGTSSVTSSLQDQGLPPRSTDL